MVPSAHSVRHHRTQAGGEEVNTLRNYLANIIDSTPSVLVGVDIDGQLTQWNRTVEQHTGITAVEALGKPCSDMLPWIGPEIVSIAESIQSCQVIQKQVQHRMEDGDPLRLTPVSA